MKLIISGIIVHFIFLLSVFDVYFNSPVINGIKEYKPKFKAASKRLVLIVADGLRASSLYQDQVKNAPYLYDIIKYRGSWGVSHTRVPTESRPGHVAMIAGLYEDPSAVTRGWKENPVEFDSVFNRSYHTWAWGSPDILPMFAKGEAKGRVTVECYGSDMQTFSGTDDSNELLDKWVIDKALNFLKTNSTNINLHKQGVIFFLHLLGIDTAGHASKPHSNQYLDNIKLVDNITARFEKAINDLYNNDGQTSFIFTSDHGMTDWGSHGAGLNDETETPIIVWGAGFKKPQLSDIKNEKNFKNSEWQLMEYERIDIEQADIAPLMSSLLAIPIPTNNVGFLPKSLLSMDEGWIIEAMLSNINQLLNQFNRAQQLVHNRLLKLFITPFPIKINIPVLTNENENNTMKLIEETETLIIQGINYYQNYYGRGLKWAITISHILWFLYLIKSKIQIEATQQLTFMRNVQFILLILSIALVTFLITVQQLPLQFIIYYTLPCILFYFLFQDFKYLKPELKSTCEKYTAELVTLSIGVLLAVALIVYSFYNRSILSTGLHVLTFWPWIEIKFNKKIPLYLCLSWSIICLGLSIFPILPVIGKESYYDLVISCGLLIFILALLQTAIIHCIRCNIICVTDIIILISGTIIIGLTTLNVHYTRISFDEGRGLLFHNQVISWTFLGISFILPCFTVNDKWIRITSIWFSLLTVLLLLSVSHEMLFILLLLILLTILPLIEQNISNMNHDFLSNTMINFSSRRKDFYYVFTQLRRSYFYLFFTVLAFFGLGNIASVNSFDPSWVRCLVTTFSPHLMGGLILLKTIVPFIAVACSVYITSTLTKQSTEWLLVLAICDLMALPFFHLVTTEGSWLDIGQSISHFVIAHACILFLLILQWVAKLWLTLSYYDLFISKKQNIISLEMSSTVKYHNE